ncbi:hypothetical protein BC828DRAFT_373334 [Blastocladiella britannica]|nr:hypothetical protein BC828DRAFT_373334 [Blastocladiella britannica]
MDEQENWMPRAPFVEHRKRAITSPPASVTGSISSIPPFLLRTPSQLMAAPVSLPDAPPLPVSPPISVTTADQRHQDRLVAAVRAFAAAASSSDSTPLSRRDNDDNAMNTDEEGTGDADTHPLGSQDQQHMPISMALPKHMQQSTTAPLSSQVPTLARHHSSMLTAAGGLPLADAQPHPHWPLQHGAADPIPASAQVSFSSQYFMLCARLFESAGRDPRASRPIADAVATAMRMGWPDRDIEAYARGVVDVAVTDLHWSSL